MKFRTRRRLQLHRETLRVLLTARDLARAAGGTVIVEDGPPPEDETQPKTNAWTGGVPIGFEYAAGLCPMR